MPYRHEQQHSREKKREREILICDSHPLHINAMCVKLFDSFEEKTDK
jgi:hypothetical protein